MALRDFKALAPWLLLGALSGGGCDLLPGPITPPEMGTDTDADSDAATDADTDHGSGSDDEAPEDSTGGEPPGPGDTTTQPPGDTESEPEPEPPVDHCGPDGAAALSVGHGGGAFSQFADGPGELVYGNQGGVHVNIALRAEHVDVSGAYISQIRGLLDGEIVATGNGGGGFACDATTLYLLRDGIRLIFDLPPAEIHEQTFTVQAELTDSAGTTVTTTATLLVVDPTQQ